MRSRIGRAGRLGKRFNKRETPHWSPASVPGLEGWWSADDALASIGPSVAARPGDRIRSVPDRSRHKRSMNQATANRQPMLGYLRPPKGNMVWWSEPVYTGNEYTGWARYEAGGMIVAEEGPLGPNGEGTTRFTNNNPTTHGWLAVRCDVRPGRMRFQCSIRTVSGSTNTWFRFGGVGDMEPVFIGDEWVVMEGTISNPNEGGRALLIKLDPGADVYVGRVWGGMYTWSDEYVETTGTPVIPDTSGLQRAMVFDGVVGNFLGTSPNQLGNAPDVTIIAVHGVESSGPNNNPHILSGNGRIRNTSVASVREGGYRRLTRWSSYDITSTESIEPRRAYLDTIYQQPDGTVVFRNSGREYGSYEFSPVETYPPNTYSIGLEGTGSPNTFANGPITDVLYFTRALSEAEIQKLEDYFLIKSGINRIVTEESEVKELETVKALAPGIWYLDGEPINEEPTQEIYIPFGSEGKQLTVDDSYAVEVAAVIPNLEGWWSADDALASVGPDVAAMPGDRIRSVPDRSRHKRSMVQATANRQPMLGYLRPPKGNYSRGSDSFKVLGNPYGWTYIGQNSTETELLDPLGNKVTAVSADYDFSSNQPVWRQDTGIPAGSPEADRSITLWVWARTANPGPQPIWLMSGWPGARHVIEGTEWQLLSVNSSMFAADRRVTLQFHANNLNETITDTVYIGTIYVTHQTWSDEFVPVGNERSIPDTTGLQRAMVFDGVVGNQLVTGVDLPNNTDVTVVAVHGLNTDEIRTQPAITGGMGDGQGRWRLSRGSLNRISFERASSYGSHSDGIEERDASLDAVIQHASEGDIYIRNQGRQIFRGTRPATPTPAGPVFIGAPGVMGEPFRFCNGPITDILYFTRALTESEIQRVEDYFLLKSGINRIVTEESEVKEWETVKAMAPGIWYLDGAPITEEPTQEITVPFGAAGKQLTVGDSYGIEVQAASYLEFDATRGVWADLARTIPAAIGEPVAAWDSVGTLGITVTNATANQQPRLGFSDCYGNLVKSSDDLANADEWEVLGIGTGATGYPGSEPGKWGEQTIIVGPEDPEIVPTSYAGIRQIVPFFEVGQSYIIQVSARLVAPVEHTQTVRLRIAGVFSPAFNLTSTDWQTYTSGPFNASSAGDGILHIRTSSTQSEEEALTYWEIGRVTLRKASWTPVHVITHDAPVIPDESNKELAVVFDGVNDSLLLPQPGIQTPADMTVFSVYCWEPVINESGERQGVLSWTSPGGVLLESAISGASYRARNTNFNDNSGDISVNYLQNNYKFTTVWDLQVSTEIFPKYARVFESTGISNGTFFQATPLNMRVGRVASYGTLNGGISRIILFDKRLSEAQRTEIRNHLYGVYRNTISLTDPATLTANTEVFWSVNHDLVAQTPSLTFDISGLESGDEVRGGNSEPYIIP